MDNQLIQKILMPLPGASPVGEAIRYTSLYDQIQEARRNEDDTLPQGVWKSSVKKADWLLAASLCVDGLTQQSKDLQLAAWLMEAWVALYGLDGLSQGIFLTHSLSEKFWDEMHPQLDPDDPSMRCAPYEWMDHQIPATLLGIEVTATQLRDLKNFSFANWVTVQHLETMSKKQKDPQGYIQKEVQKNKLLPSLVLASIRSTPPEFYQNFLEKIQEILKRVCYLEEFLKKQLPDSPPCFYDIKKQLETLKRLSRQWQQLTRKVESQATQKSEEPGEGAGGGLPPEELGGGPSENKAPSKKGEAWGAASSGEMGSREKAYKELAHIADFLARIDPHSPTPYLLRKAIMWQNKTFLDVFKEFRHDPIALQTFLSLLDSAPQIHSPPQIPRKA